MSDTHHIVMLDGSVQIPKPDFPHKFTVYSSTKPAEVAERIEDATIVIATGTKVSYDDLTKNGPKVQLLASLGVGYDNFDIRGVRDRGLTLVNVPAQNTDTVTEHAFALYSAVKRNIVPLHSFTVGGEKWAHNGTVLSTFKRMCKRNL